MPHIFDKPALLTLDAQKGFDDPYWGERNGEAVFTKNVNSAFIGTSLEEFLKGHQVKTLVITGFSTQHCVSTTTRMAGNLGYTNFLVSDATAAFELTGPDHVKHSAEEIHQVELAMLHKEFATITTTKEILKSIG